MTVGAVLSGGGARGIAHLGILKALEEYNVRIDRLSGASVGAILAAFYAAGYSPDRIMEIITTTKIMRSVRPAWTWNGLLTMDSLTELIIKYLPHNNFESLKLPLTVVATDIRMGQSVYFSSGDLIPALLASSCVPAVFNPIHFKDGVYIDGGIMDNLPAAAIRKQCDLVIGMHCNYINTAFDFKNFRGVIERSLLMAINGNTTISKGYCDVLIEPPEAGKMSTFDVGRAKELFDIGYNFTKSNFKEKDFKSSDDDV